MQVNRGLAWIGEKSIESAWPCSLLTGAVVVEVSLSVVGSWPTEGVEVEECFAPQNRVLTTFWRERDGNAVLYAILCVWSKPYPLLVV